MPEGATSQRDIQNLPNSKRIIMKKDPSNTKKHASGSFMLRMVPWKQALVTATGVYPLLLSYEWLVKQLLPVQQIDRRITLLIVVLLIASTMVFLVMPVFIKILGPWLFKKQSHTKNIKQ